MSLATSRRVMPSAVGQRGSKNSRCQPVERFAMSRPKDIKPDSEEPRDRLFERAVEEKIWQRRSRKISASEPIVRRDARGDARISHAPRVAPAGSILFLKPREKHPPTNLHSVPRVSPIGERLPVEIGRLIALYLHSARAGLEPRFAPARVRRTSSRWPRRSRPATRA